MEEFSLILRHIEQSASLSLEEKEFFLSVLRKNRIRRKQFLEQPGYISKYRTYIVKGAFRAFFVDKDGEEHTISLAIDDGWTGDAASFFLQEPASLFVEAVEDSTIIQWNYESDKLLLKHIAPYALLMMQKSQQIAIMIQKRLMAHQTLSAEERYNEFEDKYPAYLQRFPLYIIASYLGMTREFLSKIRNHKL
jgi:CRP-like cAMP-binding protein